MQEFYWDAEARALGIFQVGFGYYGYDKFPLEGELYFVCQPYLEKKK